MLKLQYFNHLMQKANSLDKTLILGKIESKRSEKQRMKWLDSITDSMEMNLNKLGDNEGQGSLVCCSPCCLRIGHDLAIEQQHIIDESY